MKILVVTIASILGILLLIFIGLMLFGKEKPITITPVPKKDCFVLEDNQHYLSSLQVSGNKIMDENNNSIVLNGIMVPDLQMIDSKKNFKEEYFTKVFECGGNAIRIPVHPDKWSSDKYYLWRYLDKVVTWAITNEKYVIIDLHFIGNVKTGAGSEMKEVGMEPLDFSKEFWLTVAEYFKDVPNVIFEIYNEPAAISESDWTACAKELIDTVRSTGAKQLILVSGVDYSYNPTCWEKEPLKDENVAYTWHVFPSRKGWQQSMNEFVELYPVVVTEWGYISEKGLARQGYLIGSREDFGEPLYNFMNEHEVGWIACWYDDTWEPPMFFSNKEELTDWGKFVMEILR